MPIQYALVAINSEVVGEADTGSSSSSGANSLPQVSRLLLKKIPANDHKMTYTHQNYNIHNLKQGNVVVLCAATTDTRQRVCFAFLTDVAESASKNGPAGIEKLMREKMRHYSDPNADKLQKVHAQVDEVKGVMLENIEKALNRGEKLDTLVDKTEQLQDQAGAFHKQSRGLKRNMWWKNVKLNIILAVIIIAVIIVIILAVK